MSSFVKKLQKGSLEGSRQQGDFTIMTADEERNLKQSPLEEQVCVKTQRMYRHPENGLCKLAADLGVQVPEIPDRRINVLIIGNHSSGKSSFINWYVGEEIQKTGAAMETSKFTVVCHGKRKETLTAPAVLKLFPKLAALENIPGVLDHLSGEVSTSKNHQFPFVNLIDTPGIVDVGRDEYGFDLALKCFADLADMILIFLDPQGQALCQRTMAHLETLCMSQPSKLSIWLTKCDTLKTERDLMKVTQQISRELSRRAIIADQELWLSPIAIPGHADVTATRLNQIQDLRNRIERFIAEHFQNKVLHDITDHCDRLDRVVEERRIEENKRQMDKGRAQFTVMEIVAYFLILLVLAVMIVFVADESLWENTEIMLHLKEKLHEYVDEVVPEENQLMFVASLLLAIITFSFCASWSTWNARSGRKNVRLNVILNGYTRKIDVIRREADKLFKEYLNLTVDA